VLDFEVISRAQEPLP